MGESDRYSDYQRQRKRFTLGDDGNALIALLTINIIVFLLLLTIKIIYLFMQKTDADFYAGTVQFFELPAEADKFARQPWSLITYMFTHTDVIRMIGNMLWLWAFGYLLQELTGNRKLIPVYIYGGLAGAFVFIISHYLAPNVKPYLDSDAMMGSSAATMAIATATTVLAPDYRFFRNLGGGIPIWVLTVAYIIIDYAGVASSSAAFSLAHLAGAAAGFIFIFALRRGADGSEWMNKFYEWFINLFNPAKKSSRFSVKEKVFYNSEGRQPYKKTANVTQQRIDEILDKINQKGYHFLTEEEKNILKRAAEEDL